MDSRQVYDENGKDYNVLRRFIRQFSHQVYQNQEHRFFFERQFTILLRQFINQAIITQENLHQFIRKFTQNITTRRTNRNLFHQFIQQQQPQDYLGDPMEIC
jgi:hypothetical protein